MSVTVTLRFMNFTNVLLLVNWTPICSHALNVALFFGQYFSVELQAFNTIS